MSRKDYCRIAAALKAAQPRFSAPGTPEMHQQLIVCRELADTLAQDNARFDRARFLAACGVS